MIQSDENDDYYGQNLPTYFLSRYYNSSLNTLTDKIIVPLGKRGKRRLSKLKNSRIINWGLSAELISDSLIPDTNLILNKPNAISNAVNKIRTYEVLNEAELPVPTFVTDIEEAKKFFSKEGAIVYCRTLINSHSGNGIVIAKAPEELVDCKLYTLKVPNYQEYRFHIVHGNLIQVQQKKTTFTDGYDPDKALIKTKDKGYVFSSINVVLKEDDYNLMTSIAVSAIKALGLDFGAVDLCISKKGLVTILEVNTAPGISFIFPAYMKAFNLWYQSESAH